MKDGNPENYIPDRTTAARDVKVLYGKAHTKMADYLKVSLMQ